MQRIALIRFDEWIRPRKFKKKVIAAEYTEKGWSGKILLISNDHSITPKKNELCFVFLPGEHYYSRICYDGINVFRVRIEMPEIIEGIKVFKNIPIPGPLLENYGDDNNSKAVAILMDPDKTHKTFFIRIRGHDNNAAIRRFLKKNLSDAEIKIINGTIRITIEETSEDSGYLEKGFWNNLSDSI